MTDETAPSVETPYGWVVVAASLLLMATAFGASYLMIVGLKPVAAEFGWPRWVPSLAYSLILLGAGFGGIVMGRWSDHRGMGGPALLGGFMVGAGAIAVSYVDGIWPLLLLSGLVIGFLGNGTVFSPLLTNATRWFDRRRGIAVAIVACGQSLAGAAWPTLFRYGIDEIGWRETWFYYGIFAVCVMVPLSLLLRRRPPVYRTIGNGQAAAARSAGSALPPGLVQVLLCVAIVGCCVAMAMPMVHVVAYCSDLGFEAARGAEMLSLLLACAFFSRLGFGWLSDRIGGLMTILLGSGMQAITLAMYIWIDNLFGLYVISGVFGLVFGGIVPAYALAVRELFPDSEAGWRIGVVFLFGTVGMALGGWLGGWVFDLTGTYQIAFMTGVFFNLVNLMVIGALIWQEGASTRTQAASA